jgi:hypothetical protein
MFDGLIFSCIFKSSSLRFYYKKRSVPVLLEEPLTEQEKEYVRRAEDLRKQGKHKKAEELLQSLLRFTLHMGNKFEPDFRGYGFEIREDVDPIYATLALEARSFLRRNEVSISGHPMRRRAVKMNSNLGQRDALKILEFLNSPVGSIRSGRLNRFILVFPGTVWKRVDSNMISVPVLVYKSGKWELELRDLSLDWNAGYRFLVFRTVTKSNR